MVSLFEEQGGNYPLGAAGTNHPAETKNQGITEALKAQNQMDRLRAMNNIRGAAEEIVLSALICC